MSNSFMRVEEVAEELGVSKSYAYKIVQRLNKELKAGSVNSILWKRFVTARKGSDRNGGLQRIW